MLNIKNNRECFFDDHFINPKYTTAQFRVHEPVRREVLITFDKPWEGSGSTSQCIVKDTDRYRLYYIGRDMENEFPDGSSYYHCYAESHDGLHWERPNLGMFEFNGSCDNNIISSRNSVLHGPMFVFIDENPACPKNERYRAIVSAINEAVLFSVPSADGIRFDYEKKRVIETGGYYDSMNTCFWDQKAGKYRCFFRGFHFPAGYDGELTDCHDPRSYGIRMRDIRYTESTDFVHWSESVIIDEGNAEDIELYENYIIPYYRAPQMLIGFPVRYMGRQTWTENYDSLPSADNRRARAKRDMRYGLAVTDCVFTCSRDGVSFFRHDDVFLRPGPENPTNWVYGCGYASYNLLETPSDIPGADNEISMLFPEGSWIKPIDLVRYSLRMDGFVSLHAGGMKEESVLTRQFIYTGKTLYANFSTSARGYLYFTLTPWDDSQGRTPLSQNSRAVTSCEIFGDSTDRRIPFPDDAVAALSGKAVTLTVRMRDADLYAIRFGE